MCKENHIVIMAGGIGSRFWPLSTPELPKQFIDILGCGKTLIQLTADRFSGLADPSHIWVVTNASYMGYIREQLPQIPENHILAEPAARNTAPCIAWACWRIGQECPDANVVVTPSDAFVADPAEYRRVIAEALAFTADSDAIVTVGITPNRPETGYGYVQKGESAGEGIFKVCAFKEKPCFEVAKEYLASGAYLWNAGIFVWNVRTITEAIRRFTPDIAAEMDRIIASGDVETIFPQCRKISIDYAVMEPASALGLVFTHPADFGWSDLGNWASLHSRLSLDSEGNAVVGNAVLVESSNCVVHAEDAEKVVIQGLDGYIVALKNGKLLICKRSEEQRIKEFNI